MKTWNSLCENYIKKDSICSVNILSTTLFEMSENFYYY